MSNQWSPHLVQWARREVNIIKHGFLEVSSGFFNLTNAPVDLTDKGGMKRRTLVGSAPALRGVQTRTHICCVGNSCFKATCTAIFTTAWANSSTRRRRRRPLFRRRGTPRRLYFTGDVVWSRFLIQSSVLPGSIALRGVVKGCRGEKAKCKWSWSRSKPFK